MATRQAGGADAMVRLKDIARDLGVSTITVSKVLRNHPDIGVRTRARVLRRAKQLGYRPNLAARALVTGRSSAIGLVVPDLVHPFFGEVAKGLSHALRDRGYGLMIASSQEDPALESQEIERLVAHGVDALIVASVQRRADPLRRLAERGVPLVLLDREFPGFRAAFVGIDDTRVGALATGHLVAAGCRRIAHICGPVVSTARRRLAGYRLALRRHGIDAPAKYVAAEETGDEAGDLSGYRAMMTLLSARPRPDGVFCFNDPAALGAMQAIFDAGLRVPEDIAVIGCGNVVYASYLRVPLSSVDQQSAAIGARAADLALALAGTKTRRFPARVMLQPTVVVRASTGR